MNAEILRDTYVSALRNTHALEEEALQIMQRQVERIENYPEMRDALHHHIGETEEQRRRIEEALSDLSESPSTIKEAMMGLTGNIAALAHAPAQDEILKNTFANHAFENYEIAAYRSLIAIAEAAGAQRHLSALRSSLSEEEAMAQRVSDQIETITRRYLTLTASGEGSGAKI